MSSVLWVATRDKRYVQNLSCAGAGLGTVSALRLNSAVLFMHRRLWGITSATHFPHYNLVCETHGEHPVQSSLMVEHNNA